VVGVLVDIAPKALPARCRHHYETTYIYQKT
jgi:hypothetical protein